MPRMNRLGEPEPGKGGPDGAAADGALELPYQDVLSWPESRLSLTPPPPQAA